MSVTYLSHEIKAEAISPGNKNILAITNYPTQTNVNEVRRFLGLAGFFRKFMLGYSIIAKPLHGLTGKDIVFIVD